MLEKDQIIKNLKSDELVKIIDSKTMGDMYSVNYIGMISNKSDTTIIDSKTYSQLEVITKEGSYNFEGKPENFTLYAEAERISSAYQFDPLFAVNCSIVDPLPHQIEAVYKFLLPLPNIRFLLADDTGAGKTIMTGLLLKELIMRDIVNRVLIITPGGLTKQWQEDEMGLKFNLFFKLVNRAIFQSEPTIFNNSNRIITSIDFIRNEDILNIVKETSWDIIVVDEAHKLTAFDYGQKRYISKRYNALDILSKNCEHLLLLTATPHRGRRDTFKNLLQLLDKDIFASDNLVNSRVKEVSKNGVNKFFIRRLKEEMKDWNDKALFKERYTKTVLYKLTNEEKRLYDKVTEYLTNQRKEAQKDSNIHVSLALMVMQRRLTSSIYAIMKTLKNRYNVLKDLLDEIRQNPNIWKQKHKMDLDVDSIDDYDELNDEDRETLESIISDPKKFKLFTTAKSPKEIEVEALEVKELVDIAEKLYNSNVEEQKLIKLRDLFQSEGVLDNNEKIVIFTEHKDTLEYLEKKLTNNGYKVVTIHGSKNVEERREAQILFARESQVLIATDAAGEGINLQFCRLLINWDIPWNPNRLEQRMGRIHRYGQTQNVLVFNMVAQNTREGNVLQLLLNKLELIREQIGNDKVFDVISDVFENVNLDDIISSTFNGENTKYNDFIKNDLSKDLVKKKIEEQKEQIGYSLVDYREAKNLKDKSDERRLQPIYIRMFFEKAFKMFGGEFTEIRKSIYKINKRPELLTEILKNDYNMPVNTNETIFCFDKQVFLDYQNIKDLGTMHYINPGNPFFDSLIKLVKNQCREDVLKGTVLVSPIDKDDYYAFFTKSQIVDEKPKNNIVDELLFMVCSNDLEKFETTSTAKFIDLYSPKTFSKEIDPPLSKDINKVESWVFTNITKKQLEKTQKVIEEDVKNRKEYIDEAFTNVIFDLTAEINEMQGKMLKGNMRFQETINKKMQKIELLKKRKTKRLNKLKMMLSIHMKPPEIIGCAYVIPLSQIEYQNHFGMSRDDEVEAIAMKFAMEFEKNDEWIPEDVSLENIGYDIRSTNSDNLKRYIEVKGRSGEDGVMLSENEMNRLAQLGDSSWLYIVINCKSKPQLYRIQNPTSKLTFEQKSKGVQYFLPLKEWKTKSIGE